MKLFFNSESTKLEVGDILLVDHFSDIQKIRIRFRRNDEFLTNDQGQPASILVGYTPSAGIVFSLLCRIYGPAGYTIEERTSDSYSVSHFEVVDRIS